ncbi:fused signal recognition particle receptor [[Eubacterium] yurii]|jgi:signal recognition particle-docking protein ftsY|nr:MAG: signal recognition particle-docking protein FtsY [Lachnospiraceae bacterium]SKC35484.1 fused signal recognition particle receptor [[Eubacterium] yurii]
MALKLFENLFKKDQAKKNEEENLKSEIEDIQLDSEQNDGSFEDETDLNTSMEKTIFEEIKNADEVIDCEDTSEVKEEIEVQEIKETEEISEVKDTEVIEKKGIFARLKEGLKKTSDSFTEKFDNLFKGSLKIDDDLYEELEEILITSDISFDTTLKIVENLKKNIKKKNINDVNLVKPELKEVLYELLENNKSKLDIENQKNIIVIVGVNGVGKTTTIGKLASRFKNEGKSVILAAGDTFRAAAEEQLEIWSKRAKVDIVRHNESGADPSAVIYDAIQRAKSKNTDILICDTAGRLHNKVNLMNELSKIMRIINKQYPEAKKEVLLVIDATTGQNALNQVKTFNEAVELTGVILTKLDGTAKGGVVLSIVDEYKLPVKFIGVGEKVEDLQEFDYKNFVDALF